MSVASGRIGSRTGRSPAARGGAVGVLEVTGREPDDVAAGKREPGSCGYSAGFQVRPMSGLSRVRAVPLAAVIPSRVPGGAGAAWGGPRQKRRSGGINQGRARAAGSPAAGQTQRRSRAWPLARKLPVHLGKQEMPQGGWTETVDSTEIDLAAAIQRIQRLAALQSTYVVSLTMMRAKLPVPLSEPRESPQRPLACVLARRYLSLRP
jgi:hypothetical protein